MKIRALLLAALLAVLPTLGSASGPNFNVIGPSSATVQSVGSGNCLSGGPITVTGTLVGAAGVDARTTTTEAVTASDQCKTVTFNNGSAVAASIAQAGTGGFSATWKATLLDLGAGAVTLTPTTSTINGAATLVISAGQSCDISSDGTNYIAACGAGTGGGGSITVEDPHTAVPSVSTISFPAGATVSNPGGGVANVTINSGLTLNGFQGALLTKTTTQTTTSLVAAQWDAVSFDIGGWSNLGSHNTRLTVPAGVTRVKLYGGAYIPGCTGVLSLLIEKNGSSSFDGATQQAQGAQPATSVAASPEAFSSGSIPVQPGDYFEMFVNGSSGCTLTNNAATYFGIEAVAALPTNFLEQHTASNSATLDFTTGITSACRDYRLTISGLIAASNLVDLQMQVGTGSPATFDTASHYQYGGNVISNTGGFGPFGSSGTSTSVGMALSAVSSTNTINVSIALKDLQDSTVAKHFRVKGEMLDGNGNYDGIDSWGAYNQATAITALRIKMSSGNIASGVGTLSCDDGATVNLPNGPTLISCQVASTSTELDFTSIPVFNDYRLRILGFVPTTSGDGWAVQVGTGSTSWVAGTAYDWADIANTSTAGSPGGTAGGGSALWDSDGGVGTSAGQFGSGTMEIDASVADYATAIYRSINVNSSGVTVNHAQTGRVAAGAAITAFRVVTDSSPATHTIASGKACLWGIAGE